MALRFEVAIVRRRNLSLLCVWMLSKKEVLRAGIIDEAFVAVLVAVKAVAEKAVADEEIERALENLRANPSPS